MSTRTMLAGLITAAALSTPLIVAGPTTAAPAPATSASAERSHDCVTKQEFRGAKKRWPMERVHRRFDTKGHLTSQSGSYKTREYKSCTNPRWSYISVSYRSGRLYYKSAYWG